MQAYKIQVPEWGHYEKHAGLDLHRSKIYEFIQKKAFRLGHENVPDVDKSDRFDREYYALFFDGSHGPHDNEVSFGGKYTEIPWQDFLELPEPGKYGDDNTGTKRFNKKLIMASTPSVNNNHVLDTGRYNQSRWFDSKGNEIDESTIQAFKMDVLGEPWKPNTGEKTMKKITIGKAIRDENKNLIGVEKIEEYHGATKMQATMDYMKTHDIKPEELKNSKNFVYLETPENWLDLE